jgi:manganese oxidase
MNNKSAPARRREFFSRALLWGSTAAASVKNLAAQTPAEPFLPVAIPDSAKLPFRVVEGVKEFHLIAEVVNTNLVPERRLTAWGYNGSVPGPAIEVQEGDRVRIIFENRLPEPTAPHWHGLEVPIEMDGVPGITQDPVMPGEKFTYEFTLRQNGTFFYHSHMPMQQMLGMIGLFIVHPRRPHQPRVDSDFAIVLQEWALLPNNNVPNTLAMEFNWLTMNGKAGPATTPLLVKQGERVRIRIVNLGMDHHPIHLHGHQWVVTGSEGGRQPETTWGPGNTVLVGVAQTRDVEFVATNAGDWMLHCHMPHHNMNQMVSMVGPVANMGPAMYPMNDAAKKQVPGYPQDMWMVMDEMYKNKPENYGLRPGWTGAMMGMMTLVRVLTPAKWDELMAHMPAAANNSAQPGQATPPRQGLTLTGRVTAVSPATGRITISHGRLPGWMEAMTMAYPVENAAALTGLKPGDEMEATVFPGDLTLHSIRPAGKR